VADDLAPATASALLGTNLAGMETAFNVRRSPDTRPNVDFTVPRASEVRWLAQDGFGRNRLPFMWELLQPMLSDTVANAQARALIGEPGAFNETYARFIDGVLDAHAAAGTRCILDCHNYCRYTDFRFQARRSSRASSRPRPAPPCGRPPSRISGPARRSAGAPIRASAATA
jgi:endoglucanase